MSQRRGQRGLAVKADSGYVQEGGGDLEVPSGLTCSGQQGREGLGQVQKSLPAERSGSQHLGVNLGFCCLLMVSSFNPEVLITP